MALEQPLSDINWNTIILGIVAALGTLLTTIATGIVAIFLAKINKSTGDTKTAAVDTQIIAKETAVVVEKIHVAVNSERTAMIDEIRRLRDDILNLTTSKAVVQEKLEAKEKEK
jgi:hypothetical protein